MDTRARFLTHLEGRFTEFFGRETRILKAREVTGGDVNLCKMLETTAGRFFLKSNAGLFGLDLFEKEARGLVTLANAGAMRVPRPLFDGRFHQQVYLVIEWLEKGTADPTFWRDFGTSLSTLHRQTRPAFGLEYDNYIARLHQSNRSHARWCVFYAQERIGPLVRNAFERGLLSRRELDMAESLCARLDGLMPEEPPSLLHGDLWNGNFMSTSDGRPAVFDPSVYFGHREMDIAMTLVFGGFDVSFYSAYDEAHPLAPGWRERTGLFQLYPMLVHLLHFGGPYRARVNEILEAWR